MRTIRQALLAGERNLAEAGVDSAALDARVLLRHVLGIGAATLYLRLEEPLTAAQDVSFGALLDSRALGQPVAYLTGHREFYGLDFRVTPATLIPRPETELLVEQAIHLVPPSALGVDVGTGSGAIAVALAMHRPDVSVLAVDVSHEACSVARHNAVAHRVEGRVTVARASLLNAVNGPIQAVLANLPYVPTGDLAHLSAEVRSEPVLALDGGMDGLDLYRHLWREINDMAMKPVCILCEIDPRQLAPMRELASHAAPNHQVDVIEDLAGTPRIMVVHLKGNACRG